MSRFDRRNFLLRTGQFGMAGMAWASLGHGRPWAHAAADPTADQIIPGKNPKLIVLAAKPAVFETPLPLLAEQRQTPIAELFVRNNQEPEAMVTLEPVSLDGWQIEITGLVNKPQSFDAKLLKDLPTTSVEMVLQCSGNDRDSYSKASPTEGTQWGPGGMGSVKFTGVRLSKVLEHLGVEPKPEARYITADGVDTPKAGSDDFQHSMPQGDVINRAILALELNDQPLPAIHGGPVRLIIPGVFGTMQTKWLKRLDFTRDEITVVHHVPRYRVPKGRIKPGQKWEATLQNSRFNWRMPVKSTILTPTPDMQVKAGPVTIRGVAFNDGSAPIETVLISLDQGQTWQKAQVEKAASRFAWYPWSFRTNLRKGRNVVWSRAIDALGRSQPLDGSIRWNPHGYEWNGVDKVEINVG